MNEKLIKSVVTAILKPHIVAICEAVASREPYALRLSDLAESGGKMIAPLGKDLKPLLDSGVLMKRTNEKDKREVNFAIDLKKYLLLKKAIEAIENLNEIA